MGSSLNEIENGTGPSSDVISRIITTLDVAVVGGLARLPFIKWSCGLLGVFVGEVMGLSAESLALW